MSLIKKKQFLMCFVFFELENLPLVARITVDLFVVLEEDIVLDSIPLCLNEIISLQDLWEDVIYPDKFRFGGTLGLQFLSPRHTHQ